MLTQKDLEATNRQAGTGAKEKTPKQMMMENRIKAYEKMKREQNKWLIDKFEQQRTRDTQTMEKRTCCEMLLGSPPAALDLHNLEGGKA